MQVLSDRRTEITSRSHSTNSKVNGNIAQVHQEPDPPEERPQGRARVLVVGAALIALFLGALDALVVGAAMPTIVSELGGLHLYSWVFSSYMLTRAVSLPIFGKMSDIFSHKKLYAISILIFIASSVLAGISQSMVQLIVCRAVQGIGAGGTFALAYIVLSDMYPPDVRPKMMGLISSVWGIASILGPPFGGFIVSWFTWPWIFYLNVPLGVLALSCILFYLKEHRQPPRERSIDFSGAATLSSAVIAFLAIFMLAGRNTPWLSLPILSLGALTIASGMLFVIVEKRSRDPIIQLEFLRNRQFTLANGSAFFSSFAIFSLSAFSPLFIQAVFGKDPAKVGMAMVPLSLGWSVGAVVCGQMIKLLGNKGFSILGSAMIAVSSGICLLFSESASPVLYSLNLAIAGAGMGFVSVPTLLIVQNSLEARHLGVATSSQQFARTLGGTLGIGISGSFLTGHVTGSLGSMLEGPTGPLLPPALMDQLKHGVEAMFRPEIQAAMPEPARQILRSAVAAGIETVFWLSLLAALASLIMCRFLVESREDSR